MSFPNPAPTDVFLGRQPIFGRNLEVYAYELLFRAADTDSSSGFTSGDQATSQVLTAAFTDIGLERVAGEKPAFVNLTRSFILGEHPLPAAPDRLVLEVLEDVEPDAEILEALRGLAEDGYRIALDDFLINEETRPFLDVCQIVKLDYRAMTVEELEVATRELKERGLEILGEKVETQEEYEICRELGFNFFQGYFLAKPRVLHGRALPSNRASLMTVLAKLQSPNCTPDEVATLVERDVALSYRVLKHINSTLFGLRRRLTSVREAVLYLGLYKVRNLVSLFLLASLDDSPVALIDTAMLRARMSELLAVKLGVTRPDQFFMAGLFSCLDALLRVPMEVALQYLPLTRDLIDGLLDRTGPIGQVLECVEAYEKGEWERVSLEGVSRPDIREAFLDAAGYARESSVGLRASA